jgi:hypothetical protein
MSEENRDGFYGPDRIEKPITRVVVPGTEPPDGILSMTPIARSPTIPTGIEKQLLISMELRSALANSGGFERRSRVLDVVGRK